LLETDFPEKEVTVDSELIRGNHHAFTQSRAEQGSYQKRSTIPGGHGGNDQNPLLISGRLKISSSGSGLCTPETSDRGSIFIHKEKLAGAMDGDTILVQTVHNHGRRSGKVVKVLQRAHQQLVGFIRRNGKEVLVGPINARLPEVVILPGGLKGAKEGEAVWIDILHFPIRSDEYPVGIVKEILGSEGKAGLAREIVIREHGLPQAFPSKVHEEIARIPARISEDEIGRRRDLRAQRVFTIDGENSKDFDDAISIRVLRNGHYELGVHIADVSHYVREGSALDREAFRRGTSIYLCDGSVIPMLPSRLSDDLCSLVPGQARLTVTCLMEFSPCGELLGTEVFTSVIQSKARLTYT